NSDQLIGEVINIAYGQEIPINEISQLILKNLKSKLKPKYLDPRPGDVYRHHADISKAKKKLNFKPKFNIKIGIKLYLDWLKSQSIDFTKEKEINWKKED
ncbi:MAG: hypothetical protein IIA88_03005, partial [Bacteroidetes bacterium]|nr:hypothetical protein [Bacteroidota bacterium]